jgi:hypothetical protein
MSYNTPDGYIDRFTPQSKWKKLLFLPGRALQSGELIEIQSVLGYEHEQLGSTFFKNGAAMSGLSLVETYSRDYPLRSVIDTTYTAGDHVSTPAGDGFVCIKSHSFTASTNTPPLTDETYWLPSGLSVELTEGRVWAYGFTHQVPPGRVDLQGVDIERIGVLIYSRVLTEVEDPILLDQQVGYEAYGSPGSHRLYYDYEYTVDDDKAVVIAEYVGGQVDQTYAQSRPVIRPVLDVLAKRTNDVSGSFTVDPYKIEITNLNVDDPDYFTHLRLILRGGLAYVNGWEVQNNFSVFKLRRALDTVGVTAEPHTFNLAGGMIFSLNNTAIADTITIQGTVQQQNIQMNRGIIMNGIDNIPIQFTPVESIYNVVQGATTFLEGTDWQKAGNSISWAPPGNEPATGTLYQLDVNYTKILTQGKRQLTTVTGRAVVKGDLSGSASFDYVTQQVSTTPLRFSQLNKVNRVYTTSPAMTYVEGTHYNVRAFDGSIVWIMGAPTSGSVFFVDVVEWQEIVQGDYVARSSFVDENGNPQYFITPSALFDGTPIDYSTQISFDVLGGVRPITDSTIYITYSHAIPRRDYLAVDWRGIISIVEGISSYNPSIPALASSQMGIAKIFNEAESTPDTVSYRYDDNRRMTEQDLRSMLREHKDMRYNQAVFQLHQETVNKNLPTDKKGVWADSLQTPEFSDYTYPGFDVTFDFNNSLLYLPQEEQYIPLAAVTGTTAVQIADYFMVPYEVEIFETQPFCTRTIQVNAFARVNVGASVIVDPAVDRFTLTEKTVIESFNSITLPKKMVFNNVSSTMLNTYEDVASQVIPDGYFVGLASWQNTIGKSISQDVRTWSDVVSQSVTSIANYARNIDVTVKGSGFIGNEDNVALYFNGLKVPFNAISPSTQGSYMHSVNADPGGNVTGFFTVPENTFTGLHSVALKGEGTTTGPGSRAATNFVSEGNIVNITEYVTYNKTTQDIETTFTSTTSQWVLARSDPVAQTFSPSQSCYITGVDIFLSKIPQNTQLPIQVLISNVVNGYPGQDILGASEARITDLHPSLDGQTPTHFDFDHPVYIERGTDYALIVKTDSEEYSIWISQVGEEDPVSGLVNENPHTGVLFVSADMKAWTPMQNSDLKFSMYRAKFTQDSAIVNFGRIDFTDAISRISYFASRGVPSSEVTARLQYSLDNNIWNDVPLLSDIDLKMQVSYAFFRVLLTANDTRTLSSLVFDDAYVNGRRWTSPGRYVSRNITLPTDNSRYVDAWWDVYLPAGTSANWSISIDNAAPVPMTLIPEDTVDFGDGSQEVHLYFDNGTNFTTARMFMDYSSGNLAITPVFARPRLVTSIVS